MVPSVPPLFPASPFLFFSLVSPTTSLPPHNHSTPWSRSRDSLQPPSPATWARATTGRANPRPGLRSARSTSSCRASPRDRPSSSCPPSLRSSSASRSACRTTRALARTTTRAYHHIYLLPPNAPPPSKHTSTDRACPRQIYTGAPVPSRSCSTRPAWRSSRTSPRSRTTSSRSGSSRTRRGTHKCQRLPVSRPASKLKCPGARCKYRGSSSVEYQWIGEKLTNRRLSLVMRHAHSAQSESPIPGRRLHRKGVGSSTSSPAP